MKKKRKKERKKERRKGKKEIPEFKEKVKRATTNFCDTLLDFECNILLGYFIP